MSNQGDGKELPLNLAQFRIVCGRIKVLQEYRHHAGFAKGWRGEEELETLWAIMNEEEYDAITSLQAIADFRPLPRSTR